MSRKGGSAVVDEPNLGLLVSEGQKKQMIMRRDPFVSTLSLTDNARKAAARYDGRCRKQLSSHLFSCSSKMSSETAQFLSVVVPALFNSIAYLMVSPADAPSPSESSSVVVAEINTSLLEFSIWYRVALSAKDPPERGAPVTLHTRLGPCSWLKGGSAKRSGRWCTLAACGPA